MIYKQLQQTKPENTEEFEILTVRFKRFHKILRQSLQEAIRTYYLTTFERFKHDIKQTWPIVNDTVQRKKKNSLPSVFSHKGKVLKESNIIANGLNQYFTDIGPSLANQINANHNFKEYLYSLADSRLIMQSIDEHKVMKIIEHLKNKTNTGTDGISNKLIKTAKNELIKPLTIIINQMLHTGIFPEPLKISKVVPLYKANDQMLLSNYRPIALMPSLSKIFEYVLEQIILLKITYYLYINMVSVQNTQQNQAYSTPFASNDIKMVRNAASASFRSYPSPSSARRSR